MMDTLPLPQLPQSSMMIRTLTFTHCLCIQLHNLPYSFCAFKLTALACFYDSDSDSDISLVVPTMQEDLLLTGIEGDEMVDEEEG